MRVKIFILFATLVSIANAEFYHWSSLPTTCSNVTTIACPSGYSDNGSNCKKDISYTFYEYKCPNAQSSQDYNYSPQNTGGDCNKTDPNNTTINSSTLDDACNSSTPPTNNCKREKFTCVADSNRPCAKVDNKWQCSPFACNNELACGYATCNGLPTSNTAIMPYEYHPIEALTRSGDACIPIQCDADYEYDDGTATKVDKKVCDGEVINDKCIKYEYMDKIITTKTETYSPTLQLQYNKSGTWISNNVLPIYHISGQYGYTPKIEVKYANNIFYYRSTLSSTSPWYSQNEYDIPTGTNPMRVVNGAQLQIKSGGIWVNVNTASIRDYAGNIMYVRFTNLCTNGGNLNNSICEKEITTSNCPDGYSEYGSTTQCRKETDIGFKEYYYHTYECPTDTNAFGETWELTEPNVVRGCVDDTFGGCLNFDIETQRCQRKIHTCPNGSGTCTLDGNNKYTCSYDGCDAVRYPCIGQMCDLALNDKISFCENESCPSGFGVYEENNKCYIDQCPSSAPFEGDDGNCYEE